MKKGMFASSQLVIGIIGLVIGILFICIPETIINYAFICLGIILILQAIPYLILSAASGLHDQLSVVSFGVSILNIILGIVLISSSNMVVSIIAGIVLIALPVYRLIVAQNKSEQLKNDLFRIILGIALIIIGPGKAFSLILQILGGLICIFCIYLIIISSVNVMRNKRTEKKEKEDSEVIDV